MTTNDTPDQELEQTLQAYYEAEAARLRAPAGLWGRIEDRLEEQSDPEENTPAWRRLFSPRRWGMVPAFAITAVLLISVSGAWLFTAAPWQQGGASWGLLAGAGVPTSTSAPGMPTPTFVPRGAALSTRLDGENFVAIEVPGLPPAPIGVQGPAGSAGSSVVDSFIATQRQIISQALVSVEVEAVEAAVNQVRAIAEGLGGFVGQLSSSGGPERQQSTMTIRIPQLEFFNALDQVKSLGKVRSENVGSDDVTERFIDLEARLRSAQREEESLLSLLEWADNVSEILTIERELSRVRSDLERSQGQLNFLERRVDLATIVVSLFPPDAEDIEPPSGSLTIQVSDVSNSVDEIKALISVVEGELDQLIVSVSDGKERSDMVLRVFTKDFAQVLSSVEAQGKVRNKEVREGATSVGVNATAQEKPDARLVVAFVERESSIMGWAITIGASLGGGALVALLFYVTYRAGRRRGNLA